jgi:hypothetical protein
MVSVRPIYIITVAVKIIYINQKSTELYCNSRDGQVRWLLPLQQEVWTSSSKVSPSTGLQNKAKIRIKQIQRQMSFQISSFPILFCITWLNTTYFFIIRAQNPGIAQSLQRPDCELEDRGIRIRFPAGARDVLLSMLSRSDLGPTQSPVQCVPGTIPPGIEGLVLESDRSAPHNAKIKNASRYTYTSPCAFMILCLSQQRENCNLPSLFIYTSNTLIFS